jgi:hypothetical protein
MDDILPGVIIDAVLGIDMNETAVFKGQLDDIMYYTNNDPQELTRVKREVHLQCIHTLPITVYTYGYELYSATAN